MPSPTPIAHPLPAPITANSVDWPIVEYGGRLNALRFPLDDSEDENLGWGRITFEKFDALRVCRGEYMPYETDWKSSDPHAWIWRVADSPWLLERYAYEKKHYGRSYGWGGDVDEMLREFSHYLFRFHDQFVEVLCDGLWFETSPKDLGNRPPGPDHPSQNLPRSTIIDRFTAHGVTCQVRRNPRSQESLLADAAFGSQKLYQFKAELEGSSHPDWTVSLRVRSGKPQVTLQSYFGNAEERFTTIPDISVVQPRIERWLYEVSERRKNMR